MSSSGDTFDVVVLGSGFSGSLAAAILAKHGMRVAIVDRNKHPRFAIGESSTPAADFLLQQLITRYQLNPLQPLVRFGTWQHSFSHIQCGCKRGFSYFYHGNKNGFQATADHRDELLVAASESRESADTHWYRADVDAMLLDYSRECGANIWEQTTVSAMRRSESFGWCIELNGKTSPSKINTQMIIDATGAGSVLLKSLGIADATHRLWTNSSAVYSHFDNALPLNDWLTSSGVFLDEYPYPAEDAAVHHLFRDGWLWHLRFQNGRTSIGYVFDDRSSPQADSTAKQLDWDSICRERPVLREILGSPTLAASPGRVFRTNRLQRLAAIGAGDDWAALPFTVGFIDPLHSTGIAHSLSGVERLCEILLNLPQKQRAAALHEYSNQVLIELELIDKLVWGCYAGLQSFPVFSAWAMAYFAIATTFERQRIDNSQDVTSFLGADRADIRDCIAYLCEQMHAIIPGDLLEEEHAAKMFSQEVKQAISPFNQVGLFDPRLPNLYSRTSVKIGHRPLSLS